MRVRIHPLQSGGRNDGRQSGRCEADDARQHAQWRGTATFVGYIVPAKLPGARRCIMSAKLRLGSMRIALVGIGVGATIGNASAAPSVEVAKKCAALTAPLAHVLPRFDYKRLLELREPPSRRADQIMDRRF
jgi:hypothetical protein